MASPRGFLRARVARVVKETDDARTFVLEPLTGPVAYRAGQFCTFRVQVEGRTLLRSYSMSSAPETDGEWMTTVKRVPGGQVSNWLVEHLAEGDELEHTPPAGRFCLREAEGPLLGFAGGSGVTPILSLAKSVLAGTDRPVRLLCADRDESAAIFRGLLDDLARQYPGRLTVVRHYDDERGLLEAAGVRAFVAEHAHGDAYVCGPEPFMELVEASLPGPGRVFSERFGGNPILSPEPEAVPEPPPPATAGTIRIRLGSKRVQVPRRPDETLLESARRAGLSPPFSCESGTCATCIAVLVEGKVRMRNNEILTDEEIDDGYVLTCQSVPETDDISVRYE